MQLTDAQLEAFRRSGVRLDAEGRFWHEGGEILHPGLRAALWRWLDRNPDGRYVFRLDAERFVYLDVDDTPHLVRSLRWEGDRALAQLADGTEEPLALDTVRVDPDGRARCRVKSGRFEARLLPAAWATLGERLEDHGGEAVLIAGAARHRLGPLR
jgi:hypothetical protein